MQQPPPHTHTHPPRPGAFAQRGRARARGAPASRCSFCALGTRQADMSCVLRIATRFASWWVLSLPIRRPVVLSDDAQGPLEIPATSTFTTFRCAPPLRPAPSTLVHRQASCRAPPPSHAQDVKHTPGVLPLASRSSSRSSSSSSSTSSSSSSSSSSSTMHYALLFCPSPNTDTDTGPSPATNWRQELPISAPAARSSVLQRERHPRRWSLFSRGTEVVRT
jgi:hypothetical protein